MRLGAFAVIVMAVAFPADAQTVAIDGDAFLLGGERIRLHGIDAPELNQVCTDGWRPGPLARDALAALIDSRKIRCEPVDRDRFLRTVARCFLDDGSDIAARIVASGWAWAFTRYSTEYVPQEREAQAEGLGVHGRGCKPSWEWRRAQRQ